MFAYRGLLLLDARAESEIDARLGLNTQSVSVLDLVYFAGGICLGYDVWMRVASGENKVKVLGAPL